MTSQQRASIHEETTVYDDTRHTCYEDMALEMSSTNHGFENARSMYTAMGLLEGEHLSKQV